MFRWLLPARSDLCSVIGSRARDSGMATLPDPTQRSSFSLPTTILAPRDLNRSFSVAHLMPNCFSKKNTSRKLAWKCWPFFSIIHLSELVCGILKFKWYNLQTHLCGPAKMYSITDLKQHWKGFILYTRLTYCVIFRKYAI